MLASWPALNNGFAMPASGFEPMTFALQKRCSTTELSRQSRNFNDRDGYSSLIVGNHPQREFESAATAGFCEGMTDVTLYRSCTEDQFLGNGTVA